MKRLLVALVVAFATVGVATSDESADFRVRPKGLSATGKTMYFVVHALSRPFGAVILDAEVWCADGSSYNPTDAALTDDTTPPLAVGTAARRVLRRDAVQGGVREDQGNAAVLRVEVPRLRGVRPTRKRACGARARTAGSSTTGTASGRPTPGRAAPSRTGPARHRRGRGEARTDDRQHAA